MKIREILVVSVKCALREQVISENQALQALRWIDDVKALSSVILRPSFVDKVVNNDPS